ncbi:uncharacterized protein DS421_14g475480 [Arachis hypogaea]|nr:uncharacterized protein DS421_14g475480 [Arachis hypogaea]
MRSALSLPLVCRTAVVPSAPKLCADLHGILMVVSGALGSLKSSSAWRESLGFVSIQLQIF